MKKRIVFLVSGNGGTLKFIFNSIKRLNLNIEIVGVIADRTCKALSFADFNNLYYKEIYYSRSKNRLLKDELINLKPDLIITNIHKIIDSEILDLFQNKFMNLHYSLLPSFKGLIGMETIKQAKAQNVRIIGATCHEVNEAVDAGKIICQSCFCIDWVNEDYNQTIDTVFKIASISLLIGIILKFKISLDFIEDELFINKKKIFLSPMINLNFNLFDDLF